MLDRFAEELREIREQKGITLPQLAARTRIDLKYLEAMDSGNFSFLPELYVKAFIKEYALALGLDEKETLARFEDAREGRLTDHTGLTDKKEISSHKTEDKTDEEKKPEVQHSPPQAIKKEPVRTFTDPSTLKPVSRKDDKRKTIITIAGSVAAGVAVTVLIFLLFFSSKSDIIVEEKPYDEVLKQTNEDRFTVKEKEQDQESTTAITNTDSLVLQITNKDSLDSAWVLIIYDDSKKEDFILIPQKSKTVRAINNFKFTLGNSGAIGLKLNNQSLQFDGRKGSVRHFKLDRNGIERLYSPPTLIKE